MKPWGGCGSLIREMPMVATRTAKLHQVAYCLSTSRLGPRSRSTPGAAPASSFKLACPLQCSLCLSVISVTEDQRKVTMMAVGGRREHGDGEEGGRGGSRNEAEAHGNSLRGLAVTTTSAAVNVVVLVELMW